MFCAIACVLSEISENGDVNGLQAELFILLNGTCIWWILSGSFFPNDVWISCE